VITSSVWAAKDLIPDPILKMWSHFVNGYVSMMQSRELTEDLEEEATREMKKFAKDVEKVSAGFIKFVFGFSFVFFFFFFFFVLVKM